MNIDDFQKDLGDAIAQLAAKHNLVPGQLKLIYSDLDVKISLVMVEHIAEDMCADLVRNLRKNGHLYNLGLNNLNQGVIIGSSTATFQGLRGKKAVLKKPNGKIVYHDAEIVSQLLKCHVAKAYSSPTSNSD